MKKESIAKNYIFILLIAAIMGFGACSSPQKMYENGNYDDAISLAVKRMHERKVKEKDVQTLAEAFNYINTRDAERLSRLRAQRTDDSWAEIHDLAHRISARQELVKPLLAFDESKYYGKLADLHFENGINFIISEARDGAAAYFYTKANDKLNRARTEQRLLAREAYGDFQRVLTYFSDYKNVKQLRDEAQALGINHIYFRVENNSRAFLPADFEQTLKGVFVRDLNSQWIKYHTQRDQNLRYEYEIVARINNVDVSPERVERSQHTEGVTIEDGFDYVLDERGNVKKDTLGNDIKKKRFRDIFAEVFEVRQLKEARVEGVLEYFDMRTRERVLSRPMASNATFTSTAVTFEGDKRALSEETRCRIGGRPTPFPSDGELLLLAADNMKADAKNLIRRNDYVLAK